MAAAEREARVPVVVELLGEPVDGRVAAAAIGGNRRIQARSSSTRKLAPVRIVMTLFASASYAAELERLGAAAGRFPPVTATAGDLAVAPVQGELRAGVVEGQIRPPRHVMAGFTGTFCEVGIHLAPVRVGVAVGASRRIVYQSQSSRVRPRLGRLVAAAARHRQVCTSQRITRGLMLFEGEAGGRETTFVVAALAGGPLRPAREGAPVKIGMAVVAARMDQGRLRSARPMTALAGELDVTPAQGERGTGVIECGRGGGFPADRVVALGASGAKAPGVDVTVAVGAPLVSDSPVDNATGLVLGIRTPMAACAGPCPVASGQGKASTIVREAGGR